jgi:hypothetical protein
MAQKKLLDPSFSSATAERSVILRKNLDFQPDARAAHLRAGDLCPNCQVERLDYDGLLNLSCPQCGTVDGVWGGCS